jgi:hypothetical protein
MESKAGRRPKPPSRTTATKSETGSPQPQLPLGSDAFVRAVAEYAWRDGLTTSGILKNLHYSRADAANHMAVKRALKRAHAEGMLSFHPGSSPAQQRMRERLEQRYNAGTRRQPIEFHVVNDELAPFVGNRSLVELRAAEIVQEVIEQLLDKPPASGRTPSSETGAEGGHDVIVCNAGGRTLANMVKVLQRRPPVVEEDEAERIRRSRLLFVAANNAYSRKNSDRSANYLAVAMAEVYGADHDAVPRVLPPRFAEDHRKLISNAGLFICGSGAVNGMRGLTFDLLELQGVVPPPETVGDLAMNLMDEFGDPVKLDARGEEFLSEINPTLNRQLLESLANREGTRLLLVLDAAVPTDKVAISRAILSKRLATDVVLGTRLAKLILSAK